MTIRPTSSALCRAPTATGNGNTAAVQFIRTYDSQSPTVIISSTASNPTNVLPLPIAITFSESVNGFTENDITITNGTISNFTGSGTTYTADITALTEGTISIDISDAVAQDAAGNNNIAANQFNIIYTTDYIISGNTGVAEVTLSYTDITPQTVLSDGTGAYYILVPGGWNGTVTPSKSGYTFTPENRTYTNVDANITSQDYSANAIIFTISGNAGVEGATLSYNDTIAKTAVTDVNGNYSFTVSYNWSGTVSASKPGYAFSADKVYTNVLADQTGQDFTATAITFIISGNAGVEGAILSYTDTIAKTATTDVNGKYSFTISYNWSGSVSASKPGYTFSADKVYTNVLADQTGQDFTATAITFIISGNAGVEGAILSYTDTIAKTATTDVNGNYSFAVSYKWSGTVSASKTGYSFSADKVYTNVLDDQTGQDFTATAITFTISGNAGVEGAILSYTDTIAKTATTDVSGNYSFAVSYNWSGTVSASKTGYSFSADKVYTNVLADQTSQDFTATAITFTISGNTGIEGVNLSYTDITAKNATSGENGNYSFTVSYNWSGTVTPSKEGYTFEPVSLSYSNVLADQTNQDYQATDHIINHSGLIRVLIYPTVNDGIFKINMVHPENGMVTVKILDVSGKILDEYKFSKSSADETFNVTTNTASRGYYMVEISMNNFRSLQRIVIE